MGVVFAAFTVAYGLFEVPTGRWGDRFGSRGVLTRIVLWWSAFTALTGCVLKFSWDSGYRLRLPGTDLEAPLLFNSFLLLVLVRFLFGAGEAGAVPNAARVVARWFPPGGRGPAQGLINTAMLIGGAAAPVAAAYLIEWVQWRWAFVIFGSMGLVWAAAFYAWFRDDPAEHPQVNAAELRLITGSAEITPTAPHPAIPWGRVLRSANVWLAGGVISCTAFASYMYFFWFPTYLEEGRGLNNVQAGWLSGMVLLGGAIGCTLGGYLADELARRTGERRWSRRLVGAGGLGLAALALVVSVQWESPAATAAYTALASLSAGATIASWWAVVTDISGKHLGALFGLMNSMGVPGAVGSQLFFGWFADWMKEHGHVGRGQWDVAFYVYAGVLLLGALGWLFIDATRSAVEPEDAQPEAA
jgi:MFS family permease